MAKTHEKSTVQGSESRQGKQTQPSNQGGHADHAGHGGQQSGGMGGMHGGDLHDVGSAQSGMTGGSGMGGNSNADARPDDPQAARQGGTPTERDDSRMGSQGGEIQQSAQREGMGHHRHSQRGAAQAPDDEAGEQGISPGYSDGPD